MNTLLSKNKKNCNHFKKRRHHRKHTIFGIEVKMHQVVISGYTDARICWHFFL